jgi:hypothetical protein
LTSGVPFGYTALLRCTLTPSATSNFPRCAHRAFGVRAVNVRHKLGRTPVGSIAQRLYKRRINKRRINKRRIIERRSNERSRLAPRLLRPHQ